MIQANRVRTVLHMRPLVGQPGSRVMASLQGLPGVTISSNTASTNISNNSSRAYSTSLLSKNNDLRNTRSFAGQVVLPALATSASSGSSSSGPFHVRVVFKSTAAGATTSSRDEDEKNTSLTAKVVDAQIVDEKSKQIAVVSKPGYSLDMGIPKLIPEWKRMFKSETLLQDVSAGLTVGCIAVPLSLAIALASGVPAEVGLVTAAVSGIAGGLMGGTTLAVTGPAAAISLLVVGAVQEHGLEMLPFITLACGGLQLASGVTRLGVVAKLVPVSVIAGFTTGVGTLILSGQVPKALGMAAPGGLNPAEIVGFIGENLSAINPAAAALAMGTSAAMLLLPKIHPKMPSALLAVGGATLATHSFGLDVSLIGAIPSGLEAFQFGLPTIPSMGALPSLSATIFLIYAMTSVESLLSCAALDKMKKTPYKYNSNQELVGQGLANMGSAMFMGMPVTSVIARSSLNVKLNAQTRLPALIQAGFVFSSVVFMSSSIAMIPMPALSGMLITTGIGMLNPDEFKHCYAVQKMDAIPFVTTIGGMVSMGLAEGIGIGCVSALAMNFVTNRNTPETIAMSNMNNEQVLNESKWSVPHTMVPRMQINEALGTTVDFTQQKSCEGEDFQFDHDKSTVWQLNGPINFVSMFQIDDLVESIKQRKEESIVDNVVVDMQGVTSLEFTGVEELVNRLVEVADDTTINMVNCDGPIRSALDQCDPTRQIKRFSGPL